MPAPDLLPGSPGTLLWSWLVPVRLHFVPALRLDQTCSLVSLEHRLRCLAAPWFARELPGLHQGSRYDKDKHNPHDIFLHLVLPHDTMSSWG